jgi:hypothetical protein
MLLFGGRSTASMIWATESSSGGTARRKPPFRPGELTTMPRSASEPSVLPM